MESKFFAEIEKKMDIKTIKDFEKEVRIKIRNEFESLRKKNDDLNRILMGNECQSWLNIKGNHYSWLTLDSEKNKKLFRLIDIYSNFSRIVDSVRDLNTKVENVKKLKDKSVDSE